MSSAHPNPGLGGVLPCYPHSCAWDVWPCLREHCRVRATAGGPAPRWLGGAGAQPGRSPQLPGSVLFASDLPLAESSAAFPSERGTYGLLSQVPEQCTGGPHHLGAVVLLATAPLGTERRTPGHSLTPDTTFALPQAPPWGRGWTPMSQQAGCGWPHRSSEGGQNRGRCRGTRAHAPAVLSPLFPVLNFSGLAGATFPFPSHKGQCNTPISRGSAAAKSPCCTAGRSWL